MSLEDNKRWLTLEIADYLCKIEKICKRYNLPELTRLTLIARDPDNDNMFVVVTNEPGSFKPALDAALKQDKPDKEAPHEPDI